MRNLNMNERRPLTDVTKELDLDLRGPIQIACQPDERRHDVAQCLQVDLCPVSAYDAQTFQIRTRSAASEGDSPTFLPNSANGSRPVASAQSGARKSLFFSTLEFPTKWMFCLLCDPCFRGSTAPTRTACKYEQPSGH